MKAKRTRILIADDHAVVRLGLTSLFSTQKDMEVVAQAKNGEELALVIDPMLATGGSACDAVMQLKKLGYKRIKFLNLISAPEGIAKFEGEHPDVPVYTAAKDERLNSHYYIVPGLGDAGDRIFGTL